MSPSTLRVSCPCCQAVLSVDPASGAVLSHEAPRPASGEKDIHKALKALGEGKNRREDLFRQSLSAEQNKSDLLKKKFEDAVRKAQDNPDAAPPPREIDL